MRNDTFSTAAQLLSIINHSILPHLHLCGDVVVPECVCCWHLRLSTRLPAYTIKSHERTRIIIKKVSASLV